MKKNLHICNLLLSGNEDQLVNFGNYVSKNSKNKTLLGILIARKLDLQYHIENLCFNPFVPNALFLYSMKTTENRQIF